MIIDFSKYSSVKIGANCEVKVIDEMIKHDYLVIGNASNLLINQPKNLAILGKKYEYIKEYNDYLEIGARTSSYKLFNYCKKNNLTGLEFLSHLPGQMGGITKMNAGMKEFEIKNYILEVNVDNEWIKPNFTYRNSDIKGTIYAIRLRLNKGFSLELVEQFSKMRENQPKGASFGSIFKNPQGFSAGALIDKAGLKGKVKGGAKISEMHANFLINFNKASFEDALYLINLAQDEVLKQFKILLEPEVLILN
ncbi:UDP-N-acetylmuramate dehydrogenase [Campylobacter sp. RM12642]|uniref:UDP-N-acetylmuramate dehydrogenase n=1 Tax=unclassified Campylobacter TaxID=2593542 RepID=UPI0030142D82|nr:UDP-N-acetylmuramate dehydrogenase [Campylobacter sp. RM12637]MBZ7980559.1 UDP-N-acetylmuramate dehydrogenase [Campylobacter sp. RM12642]